MRFRNFYFQQDKVLLEGGAAGHMANIWDADQFTFNDLKKIIMNALKGELGLTTFKLDGANLTISWIDGQLKAARNQTQLKNWGEQSMTTQEVKQKFAGRGALQNAFHESMVDLGNAIGKLTDKQKFKIFQNGKKWMSFEIMHPGVENVIPLDVVNIHFHGTREIDVDGNTMTENKADAKLLENMLRQIRQEKQKTFHIKSIEPVTLKRIKDYNTHKKTIISKLNDVMKKYKLKGNDTIKDMKENHFRAIIDKNMVGKYPKQVMNKLVNRLTHDDKKYSIPMIKKDITNPKDFEWVKKFDKEKSKVFKNLLLPLEKVFLLLGGVVLEGIVGLLGANYGKQADIMRKRLEKVLELVKKSKDTKAIEKMNLELDRLNALGGMEKILPTEGLVFFYKKPGMEPQMLKLTGSFAPVNQIMGLRFRFE